MGPELLTTTEFWLSDRFYDIGGRYDGSESDARLRGKVCFMTSGSTGIPKGVVIAKDAMLESARAVNEHLRVTKDSCWGLALPDKHVGGFSIYARVYQAGCRLAVYDGKWQAERYVRFLEEERVSHSSLVPTQVHDLVVAGMKAPKGLEAIVVGGGRMEVAIGNAARELGWPVLGSYGMTEAGSQIATQALEQVTSEYENGGMKVLPIWQVRIGERGNLELKGSALFSGMIMGSGQGWSYHEREGEWYETQDLVEMEAGMIRPMGRTDLVVKVKGELVSIEEIERSLYRIACGELWVGSFAVVAVADARDEHRLLPVFENEHSKMMVNQVLDRYHREVMGYERLGSPIYMDELPKNEMGKLQRGELTQRVNERISGRF